METYITDGGGRGGSGGADVKMAGTPGATPPGATPTGATTTGATPPGATPPGATCPPRTPRRPPRPRHRFGPPAPATAGAGGDDLAVLPPRPRRLFGPPAPATAGAGGDVVVVVVVVPGGRLLFFLHSTPWYHSGGPLFLGGSLQEKIAK